MNFNTLINRLSASYPDITITNSANVDILGIALDSRSVEPGFIFTATDENNKNYLAAISQAVRNGAVAILAKKRFSPKLPHIIANNPRQALGHLCSAYYNHPSLMMDIVGITGTNGKTTTGYLIRHILNHVNRGCGMIGSVDWVVGNQTFYGGITTPEAIEIHACLEAMRVTGQNTAAIEVSSHSLCQHRVDGLHFGIGIFTNLTQDHLNYHGTMDAYFEAKARLFQMLPTKALAVINIDDLWGRHLVERVSSRFMTYGIERRATIRASKLGMTLEQLKFQLDAEGFNSVHIVSPMTGIYNVYNIMAAVSATLALGVDLNSSAEAIATFHGVPGRLERVLVQGVNGPRVFIDYAHTPDALENVCGSLRALSGNSKLVTVFGCGGDCDRSKRPLMGAIACNLSDHVIITSDNPRCEDPRAIIEEILSGVSEANLSATSQLNLKYEVETDRAAAIRMGIMRAGSKGVVLIAGKGHETYQLVSGRRFAFDDRIEARRALDELRTYCI